MSTAAPTTAAPTTIGPTTTPPTVPVTAAPGPPAIPSPERWAQDRNVGPWAFSEQPNKWGYLNNPRWLATSRKFIKWGPDDYDYRENEEPQVYNKLGLHRRYSVDDQKTHHQCGHWHKKIITDEFGAFLATMFPYTIPPYNIPINPCELLIPNIDFTVGTWAPFDSTLFTVGAYYDIAHTSLVPGTLVDGLVPGQYININLGLPSGDLTFYHYACIEYPGYIGQIWIPLTYPGGTHCEAHGEVKYFHAYTGVQPGTLQPFVVRSIGWDMYFNGTQLVDAGYTVADVGLYQEAGGVYSLIPNTLQSGSWSLDLPLNSFLFGVPLSYGVPQPQTIIYLGVLFNEDSERQYYPYCFLAQAPIMLRWVGTTGGSTGWSVLLDTDSEWVPLYMCSGVPPPMTDPIVYLSAIPTAILPGGSATLSWTSYNVTSLSIDNGIGLVAVPNGTTVVSPLVTTTYIITGIGPSGSVIDTAVVTVNTTPVTFAAAWGYWKLEEASGNSRIDASGNARSLLETWDPVESAAGKLGNGAFFDGIPDGTQKQLNVGDSPDLTGDKKFMISFWTKHHIISAPSWCDLFAAFGDGGNINFVLGNHGGDASKVYLYVVAHNRFVNTGYVITPDVEHFVCIYYDQTGLYVEIDDVPVGSDLGASGVNDTSGDVSIGGLFDDGEISFVIDELGFWVGTDATTAIANRADLWNAGAGWSPY